MAPALTLPYEPEPELESEDFHGINLPPSSLELSSSGKFHPSID